MRVAVLSISGSNPVTLPLGHAIGEADFLREWGDPHIPDKAVTVTVNGIPITADDLTPTEMLQARLRVAELGAIYYGTQASRDTASDEARALRVQLAGVLG